MKFSADQVDKIATVGSHADGKGLYLQVAANGTKSWIYRYQLAGRRRNMGLGGYPNITLAKARKARDHYQLRVKAGIDPLEEKRKAREQATLEYKEQTALLMTFQRCAEEFIEQKRPEWKNRKHAQQWENTLETYAYPVIGAMSVQHIENDHILEILQPVWITKTETATRVRNRIELILDYASTLKYREGDNPARWRGNLANLLPKPAKIKKVKHHAAIKYDEMPAFMAKLSARRGTASNALAFTILTASRTSETLEAKWSELDMDKNLWIIPADRMKSGKEHRELLTAPAMAILAEMRLSRISDYVFPGQKKGKPLSNMSMANVLKRMDRKDVTVHGFRSAFRDWIAEKTNYPDRLAEKALSHTLKDGAEAAYQRGDLLEKRATMMGAWARYCFPKKAKVANIKRA